MIRKNRFEGTVLELLEMNQNKRRANGKAIFRFPYNRIEFFDFMKIEELFCSKIKITKKFGAIDSPLSNNRTSRTKNINEVPQVLATLVCK